MLFSICDYENRRREGRAAFVWAWMKLHLLVYRGTVWYLERKERLGKVWILRHGAHQLQCRSVCSKSCVSDWKFDCRHSSAFFSLSFENVIFEIAVEQADEQLSPLVTTLSTCCGVMCTYGPEHLLRCNGVLTSLNTCYGVMAYLRPWTIVTV